MRRRADRQEGPVPFVPPPGGRAMQAEATVAWLASLHEWTDVDPVGRWQAAEELKARSELVFPAFDKTSI